MPQGGWPGAHPMRPDGQPGPSGKHMAMLRGWNARCLSLITRNEIRDECREPEMDLVLHLRKRRLRWVGHLLREGEGFLARRALAELFRLKVGGSILMDAPPCSSFDELVVLASDRESWRLSVHALI